MCVISMEIKSPLPPFTESSAIIKMKMAEDAWKSRDPGLISLIYTPDTIWRNRTEFLSGRKEVIELLTNKWKKEYEYRLIRELWTYSENRIGARFAYKWHSDSGQWFRSYGNENWEFNEQGLMKKRFASINDLAIE